jgi:hypothetical protein
MKKIFFIASAFLISLSMYQCKKHDKDLPDPQPSKEEMIAGKTSKSYKITKDIINGKDETAKQESCSLDDIITINANHTYQTTEGATKCNANDDDLVESGTWKLNQKQDSILVDDIACFINSINTKEIVITSINEDGNLEQLTMTAQ